MQKIIIAILLAAGLFFTPSDVFSQKRKSSKPKTVHVRSYTTKKGKYVRSHYRSKPSKRRHTYIMPMAKKEWVA